MNKHERFRFASLNEFISLIDNMGVKIPVYAETDVLRKPLFIGKKTIPNRIAVQPMEGNDGTLDGKPGELTLRRYKRFAEGGAGLLWFEATAVENEGRAFQRQLFLSGDTVEDFKHLLNVTLLSAEKKFGSQWRPYTVLQLTHSGRYSKPDGKPRPVVAAFNPYLDIRLSEQIHRITDNELEELEEQFSDAAVLAEEIGFDAVDIKSCHGYLNSELLSAYTREGRYGGSFENRTRFLFNIINKIKAKTSGKLEITVRLNAYDAIPWPYGWGVDRTESRNYDLTEPIRLVKILGEKGINLINISIGNPYINPHISRPYDTGPYHPLYSVERMLNISREIQEAVPDMAVIASGLSWLREFGAHCAAGGVQEGWFKIAGFGRQFFAYPDFPDNIMKKGKMERKKCCITCGKCSEILRLHCKTGCVVHDREIYLPIYRQLMNGNLSSG